MKKNFIYGMHPVMEAVKSGKQIDKLFIQKGLQGELFKELTALLKENDIQYKSVPVEKLNKLTRENHQGVAAFISPVRFADLEAILEDENTTKPYTFVILDGITDPRKELDLAMVHDCFTITELIIYEDLGFSPQGKASEDVAAGTFSLEGELPVNTDGGLKCFGHPIGASGARIIGTLLTALEAKASGAKVIYIATERAPLYPTELLEEYGIRVVKGFDAPALQEALTLKSPEAKKILEPYDYKKITTLL